MVGVAEACACFTSGLDDSVRKLAADTTDALQQGVLAPPDRGIPLGRRPFCSWLLTKLGGDSWRCASAPKVIRIGWPPSSVLWALSFASPRDQAYVSQIPHGRQALARNSGVPPPSWRAARVEAPSTTLSGMSCSRRAERPRSARLRRERGRLPAPSG